MKSFPCPHCGQSIAVSEVPPDIAASAFNSRKSPAKAEAARRNARLPRKPRPVKEVESTNPDSLTKPVKPEPAAGVIHKEPAPVVPAAESPVLKSLTLAEAQAKAKLLKPLAASKVRDYSDAYS